MVTTSDNLVASTALVAGQGGDGDGGRYGLKAKLAAGVVALGCAAALALGGLRAGESAQTAPAALAASFSQAVGVERQRFLAANTEFPDGTLPAIAVERQQFLAWNAQPPDEAASVKPFVADQFTYREDHRQVAPAVVADTFVPDQFTYREDHRASATTTFVADQFTYREDHRGELVVAFTPDQFTYREDHRVSAGTVAAPTDVTDSTTLRFQEDNAAPATDFIPDQFTYREDHRASAQADVTGFLPGYKGLFFVYA